MSFCGYGQNQTPLYYPTTPQPSHSNVLPYPHTPPINQKPLTSGYGDPMNTHKIGDLYTHNYHQSPHILIEISKTCVHLIDLALGIERTVVNDTFIHKWTRMGEQA